MTVNELIAELQVLAAQGHGELDVTAAIPCETDRSTNIKLDYFKPNIDSKWFQGYNKGDGRVEQPCILIWADDP